MPNFFYRLVRFFKYSKFTLNPKTLFLLSRFPCVTTSTVDIKGFGAPFLKGTKIDLSLKKHLFLLEGISLVAELTLHANAKFFLSKDSRVVVNICKTQFFLHSWQELFILHEIYISGCYNFLPTSSYHLVDVGFNVGIASLFFASRSECISIDAFEPFEKTIRAGKENLLLNKCLSKKISLFNFGLSDSDKTIKVPYCEVFKGSVGTKGLEPYVKQHDLDNSITLESISLRNAFNVFQKIYKRKNSSFLVLKLDCEGSEYEILNLLSKKNGLHFFDFYLVEWHLEGPKQLEEIFIKNGFNCLSLNPVSETHGMLYAFK